jgi:hypothetical protein
MPDPALTDLMGELARLLSDRSSTPRKRAMAIAHRKLRAVADAHQYDEDWCDRVMLMFLSRRHRLVAA